jgi:diadenylate cyclase
MMPVLLCAAFIFIAFMSVVRGLRFFQWEKIASPLVSMAALFALIAYFNPLFSPGTLKGLSVLFLMSLAVIFALDMAAFFVRSFTFRAGSNKYEEKMPAYIKEICRALRVFSHRKTGALIVIEAKDEITRFISGGLSWDADVRSEILIALFQKDSPVHDGACLIRDGRIIKVKAILPLAEENISPSFGTRHRSAIGLSRSCDAIVLVVSEERGAVSIAYQARSMRVHSNAELYHQLHRALRGKPLTSGKKQPA